MTARSVTYGDLDAFLRRLGFTSRRVEVSRPPVDGHQDDAEADTPGWEHLPARPAVVYDEAASNTVVILPPRPLDAPAEPQHLIPTRRQLVERGLIEDEDFERWLCALRFGDAGSESIAAVATDGRPRVAAPD